MALVNLGPAIVDATVSWETISLGLKQPWTTATVRDLWAHQEIGSFSGGFTFKGLQTHATALLRVTPTRESVKVLGVAS